jgi:4-hydroxy-2-oxoglutarate aldolase
MQINLTGIMPPVPTPFDGMGNLDLAALSNNIGRYNDTGLKGYVALGSNGEAVHLTRDERIKVIQTIKGAAAPGFTIIVGVNEFTPSAAIDSARMAADLGADAVLVITPYFYKGAMNQEALLRYFTTVADASSLPILIYNVPQNTGVVIDPPTIANLSAHENIIGVKDSAGNMAAIAETVRRTDRSFSVMVGNGSICYPALTVGAAGAILAVACVAPRACSELHAAVKASDHSKALELHNRIAPLSQTVTAALGVAGLKAAMEFAGFAGGLPRPPLVPVSASQRENIKVIMRDTGLFPEME